MQNFYSKMTLLGALALSACAAPQSDLAAFESNMRTLCGQSYTGQVVSDDPRDADWRGEVLRLGPVECEADRIALPLAVGDDASRVWVLTRKDEDLHFTHIHTLKDGTEDPVSRYGGMAEATSATSADFPADAETKRIFTENDIPDSVPNVWTFDLDPGAALAYELNRPGRQFRAEFDLTRPQ